MRKFIRSGRPTAVPPGTHGTYNEYNRGCRCDPCRHAWSVRQKERRQVIKEGRADFYVSSELVRAHLDYLSRHGVGFRAVAACTGISERDVLRIKSEPHRLVRQSTEQRIMRVSADAWSDSAVIPAARTNAMLGELLDEGYSIGYLSRMLGYRKPSLQFRGCEKVTARTQMRVEKLHKRLSGKLVDRIFELSGRCA